MVVDLTVDGKDELAIGANEGLSAGIYKMHRNIKSVSWFGKIRKPARQKCSIASWGRGEEAPLPPSMDSKICEQPHACRSLNHLRSPPPPPEEALPAFPTFQKRGRLLPCAPLERRRLWSRCHQRLSKKIVTHVLTDANNSKTLVAENAALGTLLLGDDTARPVGATVPDAPAHVEHARAVCRRIGVVNAAENAEKTRSTRWICVLATV